MRVIVVGAGITGLSIAYSLSRLGNQVTVIEARYPGSGLSVRAIGGVHLQWGSECDIKLASKSRHVLAHLPDALDFNVPFRRDGYLMIATTKEDLARLEENAKMQQTLGVETSFLSSEEINALYPFLNTSEIRGGTLSVGDGVVHPFSLVFGYWKALNENGGKLLNDTRVNGLQVNGTRIKALETDHGVYEADAFVLATGGGTGEVLGSIGVHVPTKLVRYEMLATEPLKFFLKPMLQLHPSGLCVNQSLRGEVICSLPMDSDRVAKGVSSSLGFLETAAQELTRLLPSLRAVKVLRPWAGVIETTRDSSPVYGRLRYDNLWVAFADSGKGIMFAPAVGELLAKSIQIDQLNHDLLPYSPERLFS